jgi:hypothetical protein
MMASWGRRPCPASGLYYPGHANFGDEDGTRGDCADSGDTTGILTPFDDTDVVAGTVPVHKLHLPVEYYFDGWGRPFTYVVDKKATLKTSCIGTSGAGAVRIDDAAGAQIDATQYMLISHGPDGHGSFQPGGAARSNRLDAGSTDADQQKNTGTMGFTGFDVGGSNPASFVNRFVKREVDFSGATYDDVTWYSPKYKNTCCLGKVCEEDNILFKIYGEYASQDYMYMNMQVDVNGDGFKDIAIYSDASINSFYVIYGSADNRASLPNPLRLADVGVTIPGFELYMNTLFGSMSVQDVNGDGENDLIFNQHEINCLNDGLHLVLYGGGKTPLANYAGKIWGITSYSANGVHNVKFRSRGCSGFQTSDINNDGFTDLVTFRNWGSSDAGAVKIIYGKSAGWGGYVDFNPQVSSCPSGFGCTYIRPNSTASTREWGESLGIGDFNGDGCKDIAGQSTWDNGAHPESFYTHIIFGQSIANCGTAADMPATVIIDNLNGIDGIKVSRAATQCNYTGTNMFIDLNNDGYDDYVHGCGGLTSNGLRLVFGGPGPRTGVGTFEPSWSGFTPSNTFNGARGLILFNGLASGDSGYASPRVLDANADGLKDLLVLYRNSSTIWGTMVLYGKTSAYAWPAAISSYPTAGNGFLVSNIGSVAANLSDFTGDGYPDIYWSEHTWNSNSGRARIIKAPSDGNWNHSQLPADVDYDIVHSSPAGQKFGRIVQLADIDNNGVRELAINAPANTPDGVSNAGIIYVLWDSEDQLANPLDFNDFGANAVEPY